MDRYQVFGHPIGHSLSPIIHTLFARQTNQAMEYDRCEPPLDGFADALRLFVKRGGKGANVTLPFKEQAFALADELSERARLAKAVNTLVVTERGTLLGDNTDGIGLICDLHHQGVELAQKRILLVGAGGAARGVIAPLLQQNPQLLVITNRTIERAQQLATEFAHLGAIEAIAMDQLNGHFDLIINATSASLHGATPELPIALIHPEIALYDMSYGREITPFNAWGRAHGARFISDGLGMLVEQAAEAFALWRGLRPGSRQVLRELRRNF